MRNNVLKFAFVLMIIISVCVGVLAYINQITQPIIEEYKIKMKKKSIEEVLPKNTSRFEPRESNGILFYTGYDNTGKISGFAFVSEGSGYSSVIKTSIGINRKFEIVGIKVLEQNETPGLGTKIKEKGKYQGKKQVWIDQLIGRKPKELLLDKDNSGKKECIEAITGATISSRAVVNSVGEEMAKVVREARIQIERETAAIMDSIHSDSAIVNDSMSMMRDSL